MKIKIGFVKVAAAGVILALLIASTLSSSMQRADALQATQAATMSAAPTFPALPPSMANPLVPCTAEVTGPCDLIVTKAEDIAGVWKQYLGAVPVNAPGGMAYIRYNVDGTFVFGDSVANTLTPNKPYPSATFKFDGAQFIIVPAPGSPPPCGIPPHYQLRVLKYGDKPVALRYVPISEGCPGRLQDLSQVGIWVAPATK